MLEGEFSGLSNQNGVVLRKLVDFTSTSLQRQKAMGLPSKSEALFEIELEINENQSNSGAYLGEYSAFE